MAILMQDANLTSAGVDAEQTSTEATMGAGRVMDLTFMGPFKGASASIEISNYETVAPVDVWVPIGEAVKGPQMVSVVGPENAQVRVIVKRLAATSSVTITTGAANTGA